MQYVSTREGKNHFSAAQAIVRGISEEGGLYVPAFFPNIALNEIGAMAGMSYQERACTVLGKFLTDFAAEEIREMVAAAYGSGFDEQEIVPIREIDRGRAVAELWHGPTLAFKDMALQLLPHLMTASAAHVGEKREIVILAATSGDTGKAALEGFADVKGTRCVVFYPKDGVSQAQRLQMVTQEGENTHVIAVRGNFDDAQTGVKRIFGDSAARDWMDSQGRVFSSANSINWGRLAPQIVYYFSAYADSVRAGRIALGDQLNFVVPTGNFGNILAAVYARNMGLPVGRLICASNRNCVLADFLKNGVYDARRAFYQTTSPSMDILISSNLERMLFEISGRDAAQVVQWMDALKKEGCYRVEGEAFSKLQEGIWGGWAEDQAVSETIGQTWAQAGYLSDPHTAVALNVHRQYVEATGDERPAVIMSTASPFKFGRIVLEALEGDVQAQDDFECCRLLSQKTGWTLPRAIADLPEKPVRHCAECEPAAMMDLVKQIILKES